MKIALTYDSDMIKTLIADDIQKKLNVCVSQADLTIKVRSKQNYREDKFEHGELKCELDVNI